MSSYMMIMMLLHPTIHTCIHIYIHSMDTKCVDVEQIINTIIDNIYSVKYYKHSIIDHLYT